MLVWWRYGACNEWRRSLAEPAGNPHNWFLVSRTRLVVNRDGLNVICGEGRHEEFTVSLKNFAKACGRSSVTEHRLFYSFKVFFFFSSLKILLFQNKKEIFWKMFMRGFFFSNERATTHLMLIFLNYYALTFKLIWYSACIVFMFYVVLVFKKRYALHSS